MKWVLLSLSFLLKYYKVMIRSEKLNTFHFYSIMNFMKSKQYVQVSTMKEVYVAKWICCLRQVITPHSFVLNTYNATGQKTTEKVELFRNREENGLLLRCQKTKQNWKSNDPCKLINDYKQWSLHCKQWSLYTWKLYIFLTLCVTNGCLLFLSLSRTSHLWVIFSIFCWDVVYPKESTRCAPYRA